MPSYDYFHGTNVVVEMEGFPLLEAVAIGFDLIETKMPIYGYSSRLFDAVAHGQVIVEGSLLINYVHQDYLYKAIEMGLKRKLSAPDSNIENRFITLPDGQIVSNDIYESIGLEEDLQSMLLSDKQIESHGVEALQHALVQRYWGADELTNHFAGSGLNPIDIIGPIDIRITFGERSTQNSWQGMTSFLISNVFFRQRAMQISIDGGVILEQHGFLARNIIADKPRYELISI